MFTWHSSRVCIFVLISYSNTFLLYNFWLDGKKTLSTTFIPHIQDNKQTGIPNRHSILLSLTEKLFCALNVARRNIATDEFGVNALVLTPGYKYIITKILYRSNNKNEKKYIFESTTISGLGYNSRDVARIVIWHW